ncbi:MraY family glycosyltransferase [Auritidibacter ignavus]|uniref:MraY family glycosyltransferase n=1 Tax=Auritidibacter ignavus TaxID=678932 RepID=UPI00109C6AB8|nr:MraY family glycosyltransferase [Auritidibacter ignavus]
MKVYLLLLLVTAALSFVLTPLVRLIGIKVRAYTPARKRDMHRDPIPKLGGVAMAVSVIITLGVAGTIPFLDAIFADPAPVRGVLLAILVILVFGVADDLWDLHWSLKLLGQILAGLSLGLNSIKVEAMPVGWIHVENEGLQIALTVFAVVLTVNAFNFVDGLDGLAAGVALIGGSVFFIYSYVLTRTINAYDYSNLATLLMAVLLGACAGFLPFNFNPARIFMGEVGAQLIGLLMAAAGVAVTADVGALEGFRFRNVPAYMPIMLPLAVLVLPLLDLLMAVVRRTARRSSPFSADRGHIHHKLVDGGYTHRQAVLLLYLWTFVVAYGTVSLTFFEPWIVMLITSLALAVTLWLTFRPWILRRAYYRRLNQIRQARRAQHQREQHHDATDHRPST